MQEGLTPYNDLDNMMEHPYILVIDPAVIARVGTKNARSDLKKECLNSFGKDPEKAKFIWLEKNCGTSTDTESYFLSQNIVELTISLCRLCKILPSQKSIIIPVNHQQKAIQLCIAKLNKEKFGEFTASATDVMDLWKYLQLTFQSNDSGDVSAKSGLKEAANLYKAFLESSGTLDHFNLLSLLKQHLHTVKATMKNSVKNMVVFIEDFRNVTDIELELLKMIFDDAKIFCVSVGHDNKESISEAPENHLNEADVEQSLKPNDCSAPSSSLKEGDVQDQNIVTSYSFTPIEGYSKVASTHREGASVLKAVGSQKYVDELILSHLRLLINTRDELALATVLSIPGREIGFREFGSIKAAAYKKKMPIYQAIMSTVMRLKLGGKGYQPEKSCPIVKHVKPLTEFIDVMLQLQNIIEEEDNGWKALVKIISNIKVKLCKTKGFILPQKSIDSSLLEFLNHHRESGVIHDFQESDELKVLKEKDFACQTLSVNKALQPSMKMLVRLCDWAAGKDLIFEIDDLIGERIITQKTPSSSKRNKESPFKVPSIISLFSSPNSPLEKGSQSPFSKDATPLRVRMLKQESLSAEKNAQPIRFQSCCSWAPENISPILATHSPSSPITGPTLNTIAHHHHHHHPPVMDFDKPMDSASIEIKNRRLSFSPKSTTSCSKKRSRRSLLSDISNLPEESRVKKTKKGVDDGQKESKYSVSKNTKNMKPLSVGQLKITSFFKK